MYRHAADPSGASDAPPVPPPPPLPPCPKPSPPSPPSSASTPPLWLNAEALVALCSSPVCAQGSKETHYCNERKKIIT
jgi:hypothetical protein